MSRKIYNVMFHSYLHTCGNEEKLIKTLLKYLCCFAQRDPYSNYTGSCRDLAQLASATGLLRVKRTSGTCRTSEFIFIKI